MTVHILTLSDTERVNKHGLQRKVYYDMGTHLQRMYIDVHVKTAHTCITSVGLVQNPGSMVQIWCCRASYDLASTVRPSVSY